MTSVSEMARDIVVALIQTGKIHLDADAIKQGQWLGDLYKAVDQGTGAIAEALAGDLPVSQPSGQTPKTAPSSPFGSIGKILLIGLLLILSIVFPPFRFLLFAILGGGFRGGGGGGFSSGGGGGRSGGGGASGSY